MILIIAVPLKSKIVLWNNWFVGIYSEILRERIWKKGYHGELFVENGENLIALCMMYLRYIHTMNDFTFIEEL